MFSIKNLRNYPKMNIKIDRKTEKIKIIKQNHSELVS